MSKSPTQIAREREAVCKEYGPLFDACVREFYRSDPLRVAPHAPLDEYEPEVVSVLPRLRECTGAEDVQRILHEEFVKRFGAQVGGLPPLYGPLSIRVWALYRHWSNP